MDAILRNSWKEMLEENKINAYDDSKQEVCI